MIRADRQSARMSKVTHDGLAWSVTGCFIAVLIWQRALRQRVNVHGAILLMYLLLLSVNTIFC